MHFHMHAHVYDSIWVFEYIFLLHLSYPIPYLYLYFLCTPPRIYITPASLLSTGGCTSLSGLLAFLRITYCVKYTCVSVVGSSHWWSLALCDLHKSTQLPHLTLGELHWVTVIDTRHGCYRHLVGCTGHCVCICSDLFSILSVFRYLTTYP